MENEIVTPTIMSNHNIMNKPRSTLAFSIDSILGRRSEEVAREGPPTPPGTPPDDEEEIIRPESALSNDDSFIDCSSQESDSPSPGPTQNFPQDFSSMPQLARLNPDLAYITGCFRPPHSWVTHPYMGMSHNPPSEFFS